jgi:hypothetical protein
MNKPIKMSETLLFMSYWYMCKTAKPIGARENPNGSESNQDEGATKQYRVASRVLDEPWCIHHGAMVSWCVW